MINLKIGTTNKITVGTSAQDVAIRYQGFVLVNLSENVIYYKAKDEDGANATANNAFALPAGETTPWVLTCSDLSVIASAAGSDLRIMFVDIG